MIRRLNAPVPDTARFLALAEEKRPLRMWTTKPSYHLLRDTYYDTADGDLAEREMSLRIRSEARGHRTLILMITTSVNLEGVVEHEAIEMPMVTGLYETLAGGSEIAARVREIVDPAALRPQAAMDIDRETRELKSGRFGRATHRIVFDEVIAHAPGAAREFQEITLVELTSSKVTLEELGERLRGGYGFASDGLDTFQRVRRELKPSRNGEDPGAPQDVQVSLILMREWEVALVEGPDGLAFPSARGSGEEIAREYLGDVTGADPSAADLDLVGFATPRRGNSDLEVWLQKSHGDSQPTGFIWIPLMELMERLGGPRLRDPRLIANIHMFVRAEIGERILLDEPRHRGAPTRLPLELRPVELEPGKGPDDFLDLELSILDFNQRVMELAEDPEIPVLERFRFLSIFSSNMDEFFVVRVGRLKEEVHASGEGEYEDFSPEQLLDLVAIRVRALLARQYACFDEELEPALREGGIRILSWEELDEDQKGQLRARFTAEIFPTLTPLSMVSGPGRSFPRLVSLGLALAVSLRRGAEGKAELGYVPVPDDQDRFLAVPDSPDVIPVEKVIGANVDQLFSSADVESVYVFRASRVGDVEIDEDSSGSLLRDIQDEVEARPYKPIVRLEVEASMPREIQAFILNSIRHEQSTEGANLTRADIYEVPGLVDLTGVADLADLSVEDGLYPPYSAHHLVDRDGSIFDVLAEGDLLCHHPFHDFETTVGRLLEEAADDPRVLAIKLTLYRTGRRSPVMDALLRALEQGKDVSVFVELKARFDEESNIHWTHRLKEAGARVVYGVVGFKTHAKTALVVRRESDGVRRYVHIGTGNYNATTARFYTDLGLMSADPDLGADLHDFFNELTGGAGPPEKQFRRLLVAPHSLVQGLDRMIAREAEHAQAGRPARIQAKLNGLADRKVVKALYEASRAGVEVDLLVRSICTLRPGVPGLSDTIRVKSILGRFLEHSRIYYFQNAGQSEYYIGSADWRARNLRRRVEVVTPVDDPSARRVLRAVLDTQLDDPRAWELRSDGAFERAQGEGPDSQHVFMETRGGLDLAVE
ncbi:MAG: polyphosphate kinase 1 [Longimicrobiales bacterium]|nr:polyphosphate kinase 1 [Longimicrobiales bacterium]